VTLHEIATRMRTHEPLVAPTSGVTIDVPQAMSIVVFPRTQTWRCSVAEIDLRQILRELKSQRRQID